MGLQVSQDRVIEGPKPLSLRRNFVWTLGANIVYAGMQSALLIVLAKLGTEAMVGQYALGLTWAGTIFLTANMKLRQLQATDSTHEFQFGHYFAFRLVCTFLALSACAAACLYLNPTHSRQALLILMLVAVAKAFESLTDVLYGLLQQAERFDRIGKSKVLHGLASCTAFSLLLFLTGNVAWSMFGFIVAKIIVIACYDLPSGHWVQGVQNQTLASFKPLWDCPRFRKLSWLAVPLGGTALLVALNTNLPRFFVDEELGEVALGAFVAIASIITAAGTVSRALNQAASPRLAKLHGAGNGKGFRKLFAKLMLLYSAIGGVGIVVCGLLAEELLTILFRPEYAQHTSVLNWIAVATLVLYYSGAISTGLIAVRCIHWQLPMLSMTSIVSFGLCWVLLPIQGMIGAAIALALSRVPFVIIGSVMLWQKTRSIEQTSDATVPEDHEGKLAA
ncbi:MAG: hypothetical protein CMJ78_17015 [Planctomycetaceae bacterium]|nr:hypothetical protein [Planctomycetaceae bacterium]